MNRNLLNYKFKSFTLAEVLITLTIIGVVAAITIPTLTKKTGNEEYISRLFKAYSTLSQATDSILLEKGHAKKWVTSVEDVYELYKKHIKNIKDCGPNSGCFNQLDENSRYTYLNGGSSANWNVDVNRYQLIMADGQQVTFNLRSKNCDYSDAGTDNICVSIGVDINGQKAPNVIGRDLFEFELKDDGLYPAGCDGGEECNLQSRGYACACKVISEGAINY